MSTVCAVSTPLAEGGLAVIRISGPDAIPCAAKIFKPFNGTPVPEMNGYTCAYGRVIDPADGRVVDDAMLTVFRAPHSYTGEDTAEISCHGGVYITKSILRLCLANGCSQADRGEFTKRAFVNGKLSLTQAESVMELISAKGEQSLRSARLTREGRLFQRIDGVKQQLITLLGSLAACESVLTEEEKQMGVAVIDLGAGTTNVAVYCRGSLHFAASTSIGCEMVTSDLTKCLHIDDKQAEEIKCRYGACSVPEVADCDVSLRGLGNRAERQEKRSRIAEYIEPRVREILQDAQELLVRNNLTKLLVAGVVLTGGGCQINGIEKVAADVFGDLPVAIGYPRTSATGLSRVAATPGLATCVGLVDYAANRIHAGESRPGAGSAGFVKTVVGGIASVLRKLF